jgi:hypothetical protein
MTARQQMRDAITAALADAAPRHVDAIMAAADTLILAEVASRHAGWRGEQQRAVAHARYVAAAQDRARASATSGASIRQGMGVRACTKCGRAEGSQPDRSVVEFYDDAKRTRPWCKDCEKKAARERTAAKRNTGPRLLQAVS